MTVPSYVKFYDKLYMYPDLIIRGWKRVKICWVSPKLVRYSKRVLKPKGTVNLRVKCQSFGIALREKVLESIMG